MPNLYRSILWASIALSCILTPALGADASGGMVTALEKKYPLTATTWDHQQITKGGSTMSLKTAGIFAYPYVPLQAAPENKVVDGAVHGPNAFLQGGSRVLQAGDQVYVTKIEINSKKPDDLRFTIFTVNSFDAPNQASQVRYYANVVFQFKKGYLADAPPNEVEQAVEAVLTPDTGSGNSNSASGPAAGGQQQPQTIQSQTHAPPAPAAPAAPAASASPPPTISIGESTTDVLLAMGKPAQRMDLGKKQIYVYPNIKITFVDDKVSDMQPQ